MQVILSQFARDQLNGIFGYYSVVAGRRIATRIIEDIFSSIERLGHNPMMGQIEELLKDNTRGYRRVVEGNYKIVYWIDNESVIVESIFNCRQNPTKINEFK